MKVLFILFLTFITYSQNIQEIKSGEALYTLNSSTTDDYFYFKAISTLDAHILLIDNNYIINQIYYCFIFSYKAPTQWDIDSCSFNSVNRYGYSKELSYYYEYYYKIPLSTSYNYIVIRYSGRNSYGTIKVSAVIPYIENVEVGNYYETRLTTHTMNNTYFYSKISSPPDNYIYFNLSDTSNSFDTKINYCFADDNPDVYYLKAKKNCSDFSTLDYYKTSSDYQKKEYYYQLYTYPYRTSYVFVQYKYLSSSYGSLYAKSSYYEFDKDEAPSKQSNSFSTLTIVFISIGGVAFLGIILTIICYCCRKRAVNNINYTQTQPAVVMTTSPPSPLVEQNNSYPPS